jgi:hypothetical protein
MKMNISPPHRENVNMSCKLKLPTLSQHETLIFSDRLEAQAPKLYTSRNEVQIIPKLFNH